ncbi:MAG TPA: crosslink repair DNA glycosylase YcaQ family protein [Pyrinomonadaceae bacterium]|nr:crosslink repair DNA glycosylase YcaQ family protein [Pyrinomonadaceae bacterium]
MLINLDDLRRFTVARNFFRPTTLKRALDRMGFVQADPIRAPARAQDLILRHRVKNYHAGDLERRYATLDIEEDFFIIYGFVTKSLHALMHPRSDSRVPADDLGSPWPAAQRKRAQLLLEFVRERGAVHPREVDEHFSHGTVKNYWGGSSNATTHLLDAMHYRGLLRVARREKGIRIYSAREQVLTPTDAAKSVPPVNHAQDARSTPDRRARIDALVDVAVRIYAPLPGPNLSSLVSRLRFAVPQWQTELTRALQRAKERLSHARVEGVDWYWAKEEAVCGARRDRVRLLAPFDPVVRDRDRFELLWGWVYRFEAYTPAPKRQLGYYALPLLWRERVIGWGNLSVKNGELKSEFGYVGSQPRDRAFKRELEAELDRMRTFLGLER